MSLYFQQHPARMKLQEWLELRNEMETDAQPVVNWFVLDSKGLLLARAPVNPVDPSTIGNNYARRTYFHGGPGDYKDLQDYLNSGAEPLTRTHLSAAFESESTRTPLWAVSEPVFDEKDVVAIVGLRVKIGKAPDESSAPP